MIYTVDVVLCIVGCRRTRRGEGERRRARPRPARARLFFCNGNFTHTVKIVTVVCRFEATVTTAFSNSCVFSNRMTLIITCAPLSLWGHFQFHHFSSRSFCVFLGAAATNFSSFFRCSPFLSVASSSYLYFYKNIRCLRH